MAITFKSQGAGAITETSGASLAPACPASVDAGDILIAHVMFEALVTAPSTPSGWTLLYGPADVGGDPGNSNPAARHWIFGKIADGTEDGTSPDFGSPAVTTCRSARIYSFAGRVSGTISQLVNGFTSTIHLADPQMPTVRTTKAGGLACAFVTQNDNNSLAAATSASGGTWAEAVAEFVGSGVPGSVLQLQTSTPTSDPGTITGGSVAATDDPSGAIGCQIIDEPPTDGILLVAEGKWAPLTVDGTVAIPGSPEEGDRMFLFASWKTFSITVADPSGWTPIGTEFADGSVAAGSGTGSVKVMGWYKDYETGDGDPTIDWSANPTEGHVVINVWRRGSAVTWDDPLTATAAQTSWTTTEQTTEASSTVDVKDGAVVMGLHGVRDNSDVFSHPADGIDDSGGAITWEAAYSKSPWAEFNSDVGLDMSGDLGHRIVSSGANGVTLSMTGTLAAADTGAIKWVVQGVTAAGGGVSIEVPTRALTTTRFAPQIKKTVTIPVKALTTARFAPVLKKSIIVPVKALTTASFAPQIKKTVTVPTKALSLTTFEPDVQIGTRITVPVQELSLAMFAPTISVTNNRTITVPVKALSLTTFAPTVSTGANKFIEVPTKALTTTRFAPQVKKTVTIPVKALTTTLFAPQVKKSIIVPVGELATATFAPQLKKTVIVPKASLTLTGIAPVFSTTGPADIIVPKATLTLATFAPTVTTSAPVVRQASGARVRKGKPVFMVWSAAIPFPIALEGDIFIEDGMGVDWSEVERIEVIELEPHHVVIKGMETACDVDIPILATAHIGICKELTGSASIPAGFWSERHEIAKQDVLIRTLNADREKERRRYLATLLANDDYGDHQ